MLDTQIAFLKRLLDTPGPSGDEAGPARIWRTEAKAFADDIRTDVRGNSFASLRGSGGASAPRVLLAGHIDEIGLMITYIDDDGFLYVQAIGGWDPQVLVGQRIRLLGKQGDVIGVIGKLPIHLIKKKAGEEVTKLDDMWIDIGARNRADAEALVRVGGVGVIDAPFVQLPNNRVASRSIDNRIGAYTVLEALRALSADRPYANVAAVASAQEEISFAGAQVAAFSYDPAVSIVVDVTHATDHPTANKKHDGDVRLGGGPALSRGSANSPVVYDQLLALAEREKIPYTLSVSPRYTGTDAEVIHNARSGVATGVVSIPNRYMHSPNETIQLDDVDHAVQLIAAFVRSITAASNFVPD